MLKNHGYPNKRLWLFAIGVILTAFLAACPRAARDINVNAKTMYSGIVNGSPMEVDVLATINTGRGGSSTCTFTKLPPGFNPATLGTHT